MHDEGKPNINMYAKKYYHLGKDGMGNFLKVNKTLAKNSIYGKITVFSDLPLHSPKSNNFTSPRISKPMFSGFKSPIFIVVQLKQKRKESDDRFVRLWNESILITYDTQFVFHEGI